MLTARLNDKPVLPHHVGDSFDCVCPSCGQPVFLKRGELITHHFSHYPGSDCRHGAGETAEHLAAKLGKVSIVITPKAITAQPAMAIAAE